jgi:hypothetical protein
MEYVYPLLEVWNSLLTSTKQIQAGNQTMSARPATTSAIQVSANIANPVALGSGLAAGALGFVAAVFL